MSSRIDDAWLDATARFAAVLANLTRALDFHQPLPPIRLARTKNRKVNARVRRLRADRVVIEFGDEFLHRLLNLISLLDDDRLAALVYGAQLPEESDPDRLEATRVALYSVAEQFVIHHELFHLLCGHLDQQIEASGQKRLSINETPGTPWSAPARATISSGSALSLYIEMEADNSALQFLVDRCAIADLAAVFPSLKEGQGTLSTLEGPIKAPAFRLLFAAVWLVLWLFEDLRDGAASISHPWPSARLLALLFTLLPYYADMASDPEDADGERFAVLTEHTAALATEYMLEVVSPAMKFVLALADDDQVVQQFREPDLSRSDLFADVLLDLKSLVFGDKVMTPGAQQLLELERRRGEFTRLFAPYRYFSPVATEAG